MNKFAVMLVALVVFPTVTSAAQATLNSTAEASAATSPQTASGRVYAISGSVFVAQGKNTAHRVAENEVIASDTLIYTGDNSSALLRFEDGQVVTMQASSTFQVREYRYDASNIEHSVIVFSLLKGRMRFVTGLIGQQGKRAFRLLTPYATIGIRGTDFMLAMVDKTLYSQVMAGKITMTNSAGMTILNAGQTAVVASSSALTTLVPAANIPADTFSQLLSIPVQPSATPVPAPKPATIHTPAPVIKSVPAQAPVVVPVTVPVIAAAAVSERKSNIPDAAKAAPQPAPPVVGPKDQLARAEKAKKQKPTEHAADAYLQSRDNKGISGMGMTGKLGTLGYGAELNVGISDSIIAHIGLNAYTYQYNANSGAANYDFKLQLQTASALADWYPFNGSFRTSAGLLYDNNKISLDAKPAGGNFIINGVNYSSTQISSLQGTLSFNKVAPYIGIGWGNPVSKGKGWGLVSDIGVLFQGKPKVDLVVTCVTTCPAQLQTDAAAENTKLQNDLSGFRWWPVVSIGISYQW